MHRIKYSHFNRWLSSGQQPDNYQFVTRFTPVIRDFKDIPKDLLDYEWPKSFETMLVIVYDEWFEIQSLEIIHDFLRQQCCDIENIVLLTTHQLGINDWWQARCQLYHEKTFKIKEWLFVRNKFNPTYFESLDPSDKSIQHDILLKNNIVYLFNSYTGANPKLDRLYIGLKLKELEGIGIVDCITDFEFSEQQMINHAMYLGHFKNVKEEEKIFELYQKFVIDNRLRLDTALLTVPVGKVRNELFKYKGAQFYIDSMCLATIVNETDNTQPWFMVTEKTLRAFWHHTVVIPVGYNSIHYLEQKGFWFPHDLIDYSYQTETDWLTRINLMIQSVQHTYHCIHGRYNEYYQDNVKNFRHNAQLIYDHYHSDIDC